jgi:hypothetical protein
MWLNSTPMAWFLAPAAGIAGRRVAPTMNVN